MAEILWSGHWNGSVNLWDAAAGSLLRTLARPHGGCAWALQPLTGQAMASAGADGVIRLWDARQAEKVHEWGSLGATYALASTGGSTPLLVSAGHDGEIRLWDPRMLSQTTLDPMAKLQAHRAPVRSLLVHCGAVWSGSTDGTVRSWELAQLIANEVSPSTRQAKVLDNFIATGTTPPSFVS